MNNPQCSLCGEDIEPGENFTIERVLRIMPERILFRGKPSPVLEFIHDLCRFDKCNPSTVKKEE